MAGPIKLTEVDFEQIKENLIDYLKSTRQFTDYDFSGSNLQVILNLISYQAQLNSYTANMVANESFLASSTIRKNVVENANMLGYTPTSARSSVVRFDFEIQLSATNYPSGFPSYLRLNPGPVLSAGTGNGSYTFNVVDLMVSGVASADGKVKFVGVEAREGTILEQKYTVSHTRFNQKFELTNSRVDTSSIRVEVQESPNENVLVPYHQANDLVTLTSESRVYWIEETGDGFYEIRFGDGHFGKKLQDGADIYIKYIVTVGAMANGIQDTAKFRFGGSLVDPSGVTVGGGANITDINMINTGSNPEDVSSIKLRAPRSYEAQKRCVTVNDYESIIRQIYPATEDVYAYGGETLDIPEFGRIYVAIKPVTGDRLSMVAKNYIKKSLEPFRVGSLDIRFVDPEVVNVEIRSTVYFDDRVNNKDAMSIAAAAEDAVARYKESTIVSKFGGTIRNSVIGSIINDADPAITRNKTEFLLRKDIRPLMGTRATYECCFVNELEIDCNNPVLISSGFYMNDEDTLYFMEDDSNGNINVFYFTADNRKVVKYQYFGKIDYDTGEISLGYDIPLKVTDLPLGESHIKFTAVPREQDVVAKESVFLQLDLAGSRFTAVEDNSVAR